MLTVILFYLIDWLWLILQFYRTIFGVSQIKKIEGLKVLAASQVFLLYETLSGIQTPAKLKVAHDLSLLLDIIQHRQIRKEKKISFQEMSYRCDIEKANLVKLASRGENITANTLYKISKGLEVPLKIIFDF